MSDHAPGPWVFTEGDVHGDLVLAADSDHVYMLGNMEGSCGRCHAIGRLMAAAPDLLAACQALLATYDKWYPDDIFIGNHNESEGVQTIVANRNRLRAAIAKATAETNQ